MGLLADDLARFSQLLCERVGISGLDASGELDQVLADRMRATACRTSDAYFELLMAPETTDQEMCQLAEQLTVGETYFFRYPEQFQALTEVVLPALAQRVMPLRPVRMLSAGCASGEEAYTLAMAAREFGLDRMGRGVRIEGVDINGLFLAKARRARYSAWSLRGVSPAICDRYFREQRGAFALHPALREMVTFEQGNLMQLERVTQPEAYDVIFCRNVLIYFSVEAIQRLLSALARSLAPGGYLFLGHAETARLAESCFALEHSHDTYYYRKQEVTPASARAALPVTSLAGRRIPGPSAEARELTLEPLSPRGLDEARALFIGERFVEAEAVLRGLAPREAESPEALLLLGAVLLNSGRGPAVEAVCRRALASDEFSAGAHYLLALYYDQAGEFGLAVKGYEAAAYLDSRFSLPHLRLGLLAKRGGDRGQARRALAQALALLPAEDDARLALFGGGFGRAALEQLCRAELGRDGVAQ